MGRLGALALEAGIEGVGVGFRDAEALRLGVSGIEEKVCDCRNEGAGDFQEDGYRAIEPRGPKIAGEVESGGPVGREVRG